MCEDLNVVEPSPFFLFCLNFFHENVLLTLQTQSCRFLAGDNDSHIQLFPLMISTGGVCELLIKLMEQTVPFTVFLQM